MTKHSKAQKQRFHISTKITELELFSSWAMKTKKRISLADNINSIIMGMRNNHYLTFLRKVVLMIVLFFISGFGGRPTSSLVMGHEK